MPGRGAEGGAGIAGRGAASLAARSGRGGTTGLAAGCPAKGLGAPGAPEDVGAGRTSGFRGENGWRGRFAGAVPGVGRALSVPGSGCRGPERTCPGRGGTAGPGIGLGAGVAGRPGTPLTAGGVEAEAGAGAGGTGRGGSTFAGGCGAGGGCMGRPAKGGRIGV